MMMSVFAASLWRISLVICIGRRLQVFHERGPARGRIVHRLHEWIAAERDQAGECEMSGQTGVLRIKRDFEQGLA